LEGAATLPVTEREWPDITLDSMPNKTSVPTSVADQFKTGQ
jgi:hypothetical protein